MKKIILLIAVLSFVVNTFSQDTIRQAFSKEYYLKKSKNQKTIAWVLLGTGTTLAIIGLVAGTNEVANSYYPFLTDEEASSIGTDGALLVIGAAIDVASIPFFISAGKNKRRAAEVAISNQKMYLPQKNSMAIRYAPGITIKIDF
jgi:hypothetical protein